MIVENFDAVRDDPDFRRHLYNRLENTPESHSDVEKLKFRSGISPVAKNIINIRFKQKPKFEVDKVKKVEQILKDLIDFGFADHVDEQLLEFDEAGNLKSIIDGKYSDKRALGAGGAVGLDSLPTNL